MTRDELTETLMGRIRRIVTMGLYHLVFLVGFTLYAPILLWRMVLHPSYRRGIRERMGWVRRVDSARPVVWIHGVSVGEVKAAGSLIEALRREYPEFELVVSSTTPTGHSLAQKLYPDLHVIYYPLDFGRFPARALDRIKPACVLLMELEIWPNFLHGARRRRIPVAVINGRMSEQSFKGYRLVRGLLPQFDLIELYCVQNDAYRNRLLALDVDERRLSLTGNIKYDSVALKAPPAESQRLRDWLSPDGRMVLVCGSTHGEEDTGLASGIATLSRALGAPVRLVLAPRHPERAPAVRDAVQGRGQVCVSWSGLAGELTPLGDADIVLVDTIGQLENFYGACDVAFVGGSMVRHGGQNMMEPAALGKAVVFGPHTYNFTTDVQLLCSAEAAVQVADWDELLRELERLFRDPDARRELGDRAVSVIRDNQGATDRTVAALEPLLEPLRS